MQYGKLGSTSIQVSKIAIGALHFGNLCDLATARQIVTKAHEQGVNFIDTAPMYGNGHSESFIGDILEGTRPRWIVASKVGLEPIVNDQGQFGVRTTALTEANLRASVEKSLRHLRTDYLDLLQLHAFDPTTPPVETLATLTALVKEGKVRTIGCSNYDREQLKLMTDTINQNSFARFASIQSHYNILERRLETDLLPICLEENISILPYRGLARGILSTKYQMNQPPPENSRGASSDRIRRRLTEDTLILVERLNELSASRGKAANHAAIAWLTAKPYVASVLLGMRSVEQLNENIAAATWQPQPDFNQLIEERVIGSTYHHKVMSEPDTFLET